MNIGNAFIDINKVDEHVKKTYEEIKILTNIKNLSEPDKINNDILKALDNLYIITKNTATSEVYHDMIQAFNATDSDILRKEIESKSNIII